MAAIRWDNIDAPNFNGVSAILDAAGKSMNTGLTALQAPVAEANALVNRNWDTTRTNNTNAGLAKTMEFTDPEKLKEAMRNGLYQQLIGDGSQPIDERAIMSGLDSRAPTLQARRVAEINYNNAVTDNEQQGVRQQAQVAFLNGDMARFKELVSGLRDPSALVTAGVNQQHYLDQQKWAQANYDLKKSLIDAQVTLTNAKAGDPDNYTANGGGGGSKGKVGADGKPIVTEEQALAQLGRAKKIAENPYYATFDKDKAIEFAQKKVQDKRMNTFLSAGISHLDPDGIEIAKGLKVPYPQWLVEQGMSELADDAPFGPLVLRDPVLLKERIEDIAKRPGVKEKIAEAHALREEEASSEFKQLELARKAKVNLLNTDGSPQAAGAPAAAQDSVTAFMANPRVRNFATGGYQDPVPVDPRTAPAANQAPVIPAQVAPTRMTYGQLMGTSGGDEKKKK